MNLLEKVVFYSSIATVSGLLRHAGVVSPRRNALRATYQVTLEMPDGQTATIPCDDDVFILDAAEEAGLELPSSCRSGACTSCQGRVLKGSVSMDDQDTLEEEHIAAGYVCTCIAYPESDLTIKTHQMDNFENGVMTFDDEKEAAEESVKEPEPVAQAKAEEPPVAKQEPPTAAPPAPSGDVDALKIELAKKTLGMLKDVVAGRSDLVAKCDELALLLDSDKPIDNTPEKADSPPADMANYIPFRSDDCGYTIWLNRDDHTNSYYEYHDKKKN